jgi:hypothetical protein
LFQLQEISDTAKVLKNYSDIDSVTIDEGRNFYSSQRFDYDSSKKLEDTVINTLVYKRIRINKSFNGNPIYLILYYMCDKKGKFIKLFKPISDSIGCSIVRDDTFIEDRLFMTIEPEFVSDNLSKNELRIFDAWEKNARK